MNQAVQLVCMLKMDVQLGLGWWSLVNICVNKNYFLREELAMIYSRPYVRVYCVREASCYGYGEDPDGVCLGVGAAAVN